MLWWKHTVTLFRQQKTTDTNGRTHVSFTREVVNGADWRNKALRETFDNGSNKTPVIVCRLPQGISVPNIGDYIFYGEVQTASMTIAGFNSLIESGYVGCKITDVSDNTLSPVLKHYCVKGE